MNKPLQLRVISHSDYADNVYRWLNNVEYGKTYVIDAICAKENQPIWIEIVKEYMTITPWQGGFEFSSDYTKLRRVRILPVNNKPETANN